MDPVLAVSLGVSMTFVAFGHVCLHHFLAIEQPDRRFPLWVAVFPWPKRGRAVAAVAGLAALPFLWVFGIALGSAPNPKSDGALLVFVLFATPLLAHAAWLVYCIDWRGPGLAFVSRQPSARAVRWTLAIPAAINVFTYALNRFT
jgi:hypothetical protein